MAGNAIKAVPIALITPTSSSDVPFASNAEAIPIIAAPAIPAALAIAPKSVPIVWEAASAISSVIWILPPSS